MSEPLVLIDSNDPQLTVVTLNRPEKRNALNIKLLDALCQAVADAEADSARRVMILRGAGPAFCAGLDLLEAMDEDIAEQSAHRVAHTLETLYDSRLVIIAAVHGVAAAGGAGIMSACDLVVAADDARIGYPEVHRGLVAGLILGLLYRQVGERHTRELVLLGQFIEARRALEMGLVDQIVPAEKLMDTAHKMSTQLMMGGPSAIERTKRLIREISMRSLHKDLELALGHHMAARNSPEAQEGLRAFVEKRSPRW